MPKTAGIILVGNEILSGKIEDANAAYLCRELRALGVDVARITVIPDEVQLIAEEVASFSRKFDVVFTSGGVGPTHDDVTIEGVARAMGAPVVRHPYLVELLERYYRGKVTEAALRMAEIPDGAELVGGETVRFPTILMRNVYVLPGVPEIFRAKFEALRERFRDQPIHLRNVFVTIGEGTLADFLNRLLGDFPLLQLGSYPEFSNPEYKVKVTLESRDRSYVEQALADFLARLPADVVVRVT
jgi:molybdenum cofactor synthesis domain-containing protein